MKTENIANHQRQLLLFLIPTLFVILPLANCFNRFWTSILGLPSAQLCSIFLGSPCITTPEGYILDTATLPIHVTQACSAANFFLLTFILVTGAVIQSFRIKELLKILWILPASYIVTILANSARIIAGWIMGQWARAVLAERFWASVHLGTGVVVFLTFLIVIYLLLMWRPLHGCQRTKTSDC